MDNNLLQDFMSWHNFKIGFLIKLSHHGVVYWCVSILFVLLATPFTDCHDGPPAKLLFGLGGVFLLISMFNEFQLMQIRQRYFNFMDMYEPAKQVTGIWGNFYFQLVWSAMAQFSYVSEGVLVPQVFQCHNDGDFDIDDVWLATWKDSIFSPIAVPIFSVFEFRYVVLTIYLVTVLYGRGLRGHDLVQKTLNLARIDQANNDLCWVGAAPTANVARWAGLMGISNAMLTLNRADIALSQHKDREDEDDKAMMKIIRDELLFQKVFHVYIAVTLFQLTFDRKDRKAKGIITLTIAASVASTIKTCFPVVYFYNPEIRRQGLIYVTITLALCCILVAKAAAAYVCEGTWDLIPPHCVDEDI